MGTVTIAATFGAGGSIIGPAVAKRLKLPFVDRAIPTSLVEKIHEPLVAALADDSERSSAVGRVLNSALNYSGLWVGVAIAESELGVSPDVAKTEAAIRRLPGAGGAVILGRAGVFGLTERSRQGGERRWPTKASITRPLPGCSKRLIRLGARTSATFIQGRAPGRIRAVTTWFSTARRYPLTRASTSSCSRPRTSSRNPRRLASPGRSKTWRAPRHPR